MKNLVGFSYVDITTKGCEGWLNLFWGDYCVALVNNVDIANQMRQILPTKNTDKISADGSGICENKMSCMGPHCEGCDILRRYLI